MKRNEMERRCDVMHQHALMCRTVVFVFRLADDDDDVVFDSFV